MKNDVLVEFDSIKIALLVRRILSFPAARSMDFSFVFMCASAIRSPVVAYQVTLSLSLSLVLVGKPS